MELRAGADERALVATGAGRIDLGDTPGAHLAFKARQIDVGKLAVSTTDGNDNAQPTLADDLAALKAFAGNPDAFSALPFPVTVDYSADTLSLGSQTLANLAGTTTLAAGKPATGAVTIESGDGSRVRFDGSFEPGSAAVFKGFLEASTHDLGRLADQVAPGCAGDGRLAETHLSGEVLQFRGGGRSLRGRLLGPGRVSRDRPLLVRRHDHADARGGKRQSPLLRRPDLRCARPRHAAGSRRCRPGGRRPRPLLHPGGAVGPAGPHRRGRRSGRPHRPRDQQDGCPHHAQPVLAHRPRQRDRGPDGPQRWQDGASAGALRRPPPARPRQADRTPRSRPPDGRSRDPGRRPLAGPAPGFGRCRLRPGRQPRPDRLVARRHRGRNQARVPPRSGPWVGPGRRPPGTVPGAPCPCPCIPPARCARVGRLAAADRYRDPAPDRDRTWPRRGQWPAQRFRCPRRHADRKPRRHGSDLQGPRRSRWRRCRQADADRLERGPRAAGRDGGRTRKPPRSGP